MLATMHVLQCHAGRLTETDISLFAVMHVNFAKVGQKLIFINILKHIYEFSTLIHYYTITNVLTKRRVLYCMDYSIFQTD